MRFGRFRHSLIAVHVYILLLTHTSIVSARFLSSRLGNIRYSSQRNTCRLASQMDMVLYQSLDTSGGDSTEKTNSRGAPISSIKSSSVNLLKNCVGAGVFSLSSRVMAISTNPAIQFPAAALITLMALWATYNFYIVGKSCEITQSTSYGEVWEKTVNQKSRWIIQLVVTIAPMVSCLASTIVLTDILSLVMASCGFPPFIHGNRNAVISILTSCILFPLCSVKDLSALKSVSVFGLGGQVVATISLLVRLFDRSYTPGGVFYPAALATVLTPTPPAPVLDISSINWSKMSVFASLLSYCFVAHYNAPRYYTELSQKSPKRFQLLSMISYGSAAAIYIVTMALGIAIFGPESKPFLLNNMSFSDPLALVARLAFGASVLASFPLIFLVMRNWFVTQASAFLPGMAGTKRMTMTLLAAIALVSSRFTDVSFVGSLAGATLGTSMAFIFPSVMYVRALVKQARLKGFGPPWAKIGFNLFLLICGIGLSAMGTFNSLFAFNK